MNLHHVRKAFCSRLLLILLTHWKKSTDLFLSRRERTSETFQRLASKLAVRGASRTNAWSISETLAGGVELLVIRKIRLALIGTNRENHIAFPPLPIYIFKDGVYSVGRQTGSLDFDCTGKRVPINLLETELQLAELHLNR